MGLAHHTIIIVDIHFIISFFQSTTTANNKSNKNHRKKNNNEKSNDDSNNKDRKSTKIAAAAAKELFNRNHDKCSSSRKIRQCMQWICNPKKESNMNFFSVITKWALKRYKGSIGCYENKRGPRKWIMWIEWVWRRSLKKPKKKRRIIEGKARPNKWNRNKRGEELTSCWKNVTEVRCDAGQRRRFCRHFSPLRLKIAAKMTLSYTFFDIALFLDHDVLFP